MTYTYDEADRLLTATRGGLTTTLTYDKAGRKTSMDDPDMGYWSYSNYDGVGNLITQTDARACTLTMGYDLLNRMTSKSSSGVGCVTQISTTYTYDAGTNGKGHRTGMSDGSVSAAWFYNERGELIMESKTIGSEGPIYTHWTYNSAGLPATMTYPGGEEVTYEYNSRMLLDSLIGTGTDDYVTGTTYDAAGRVTSRTLGNTLTQAFTYYGWAEKATVDGVQTGQGGRLKQMTTGTLQNLTYTYDAVGNVRQIVNSVAPETQQYEYDAIDRLTKWTLGAQEKVYTYNTAGKLNGKEGFTLTYGDSNHPHAVTASGSNLYGYDANGNMTSRGPTGQQYTLGYNAEGRLVTVTGPSGFSAAFTYDGDGQRVKQVINGTTTYFVGNYYEKTGSTITKYYYAGATRIAVRTGSTLTYLLGDHLGSTSVVTNSSGALLMETRYKPFAHSASLRGAHLPLARAGIAREVRYATTGMTLPTRYTFTGQYSYVSDEATDAAGFGLMYFNARWVDPWLGRFAQADSIVPGAGNPQALDRYAYGLNNPLRYTDPSGHIACEGLTGYQCKIRGEKAARVGLIGYLEQHYAIEIEGPWPLRGLQNLLAAIGLLSRALGGVDQLNYWFAQASPNDRLTFLINPSNSSSLKPACGGHACWNGKGTITLDAYSMTQDYIEEYFPKSDNRRPISLGLRDADASLRMTMIHEMMHALIQANPASQVYYESFLGPDASVVFDPKRKSPNDSMATSMAIYASTGGVGYLGYIDQTYAASIIFQYFFSPLSYWEMR